MTGSTRAKPPQRTQPGIDTGGTSQGQPHSGPPNGYDAERAQRTRRGGGWFSAAQTLLLSVQHNLVLCILMSIDLRITNTAAVLVRLSIKHSTMEQFGRTSPMMAANDKWLCNRLFTLFFLLEAYS